MRQQLRQEITPNSEKNENLTPTSTTITENTLSALPPELIWHIFSSLHLRSLASLKQTDTFFNNTVDKYLSTQFFKTNRSKEILSIFPPLPKSIRKHWDKLEKAKMTYENAKTFRKFTRDWLSALYPNLNMMLLSELIDVAILILLVPENPTTKEISYSEFLLSFLSTKGLLAISGGTLGVYISYCMKGLAFEALQQIKTHLGNKVTYAENKENLLEVLNKSLHQYLNFSTKIAPKIINFQQYLDKYAPAEAEKFKTKYSLQLFDHIQSQQAGLQSELSGDTDKLTATAAQI